MSSPLSLAQKKFIEKQAERGISSPKIAKKIGKSVWTVRKWRQRLKRNEPISSRQGRPPKGALSSYSSKIKELIAKLREDHKGWGASNILIELEEEYNYSLSDLPSIASVNRYLKEQGFIKYYEPPGKLPPSKKCNKRAKKPHDLWEMDAQGAIGVKGIGSQALINIKDVKSKLHIMNFPADVINQNTQPSTKHYYWALRLAFLQWGLPKVIQVDKDSVFIENRSKSPFPKILHLWLIGLGIELCFIKLPPPQQNAMVERSHQTMERQVIAGQQYDCWKHFFEYCNKRLKRMNEKVPNRLLDKKAPLQAFPKAVHSGRIYSIEQEAQLIDIIAVHKYLSKWIWYRKVSNAKTVSLGGQVYYLKNAKAQSQLQINFCNRAKKLVFRDANELVVAKQPIKMISIENLMGGTTKTILSMKNKLYHFRDCSL